MKKHCLFILFALVSGVFAPAALQAASENEIESAANVALAAPRGSLTGVVLDDNRHAIQGAVVYIRSLNLSNSVSIVLYEALRQNGFEKMQMEGNLTKYTWK